MPQELKISPQKLHKIFKGAAKEVKEALEGNDNLGKHDTQVPCAIPSCKGTIIEHRHKEYLGDPMDLIIGPGSRNQMTLVVNRYCSRCGISYHHLPEEPRTELGKSEK